MKTVFIPTYMCTWRLKQVPFYVSRHDGLGFQLFYKAKPSYGQGCLESPMVAQVREASDVP